MEVLKDLRVINRESYIVVVVVKGVLKGIKKKYVCNKDFGRNIVQVGYCFWGRGCEEVGGFWY